MSQEALVRELHFAEDLAYIEGGVLQDYFYRDDIGAVVKPDGSDVTLADQAISDDLVRFCRRRGKNVVSEESGRSAEYGDPDAFYVDPIDGTSDFIQGRNRNPKRSLAMISIGGVMGGHPVIGVANAPLLPKPRLYSAAEGMGAYRMLEDGNEIRLHVDQEPSGGVVLVSDRYFESQDQLTQRGFTVVRLCGAVFKACCVVDPSLLGAYDKTLVPPEQPIVGFVSESAWAHDYAATAVIAREAGAIATALDGGPLRLTTGKHGCIFANNETTHAKLVDCMRPTP